jgi:large subunit ribosomal protein L15
VSLSALERSFRANEEVTPELLHERGLIKKAKRDVVVLGTGEISKPCVSRRTVSQKKNRGAGGADFDYTRKFVCRTSAARLILTA